MLGILANYHKYEARNAMLVRFEDLVDETIMRRLRETAATSLQISREFVDANLSSMKGMGFSLANVLPSFAFFPLPPLHLLHP